MERTIQLKDGTLALVDSEDYARLVRHQWRRDRDDYAARTVHFRGEDGLDRTRCVFMHREVVGAPTGETTVLVDHKNGNTLDNRRKNLRFCSVSQNQQNRHHRSGVSAYKGVCWHSRCRKWQAQIKLSGRNRYLGLFENEVDAAKAYDTAAREMFGEFANTNFPKGSEAA